MKMTKKQKATMKILSIAFITGTILTIILHLSERYAEYPELIMKQRVECYLEL
jgi:hypothetical protein